MRKDISVNQVILDYRSGMKVCQIAKKFNCTHKVIKKRLVDFGITNLPNTNKSLVGMDEQLIEEYVSGKSTNELSKKYGVSNVTIINKLKENGIDRRSFHYAGLKYPFNENYFDFIDSEDKAYFFGFLVADGCNQQSRNTITFLICDPEPVYRLAEVLDSKRPVYIREGQRKNDSTVYNLTLASRHMCDQLAEKGCVQRKTLIMKFPNKDVIPEHLMNHFIRGYFDGDGCIHIRKNSNNRVVHIIGTEDFCLGMQKVIPVKTFVHKRTNNSVFFLGIYRKDHIKEFANWLYKDAVNFMERKRLLFDF